MSVTVVTDTDGVRGFGSLRSLNLRCGSLRSLNLRCGSLRSRNLRCGSLRSRNLRFAFGSLRSLPQSRSAHR